MTDCAISPKCAAERRLIVFIDEPDLPDRSGKNKTRGANSHAGFGVLQQNTMELLGSKSRNGMVGAERLELPTYAL